MIESEGKGVFVCFLFLPGLFSVSSLRHGLRIWRWTGWTDAWPAYVFDTLQIIEGWVDYG